MSHLIHIAAAAYRYPSGRCVGPFDLDVGAGEFVVLAGRTGSGKSTLARMVVGLAQRHGHGEVTGVVAVAGRDPEALSGPERVRTLGFVPQEVDDCVLAGTCAGEVAFALESAGLAASGVGTALDRVGLGGFEQRDPLDLSGGERQRLAIAAALAADPRVLVLDEPLSQLDPEGAHAIVSTLRQLANAGVAVVLVEHRLGLLGCADRIVYLGPAPEPVPMFHVEHGASGEVLLALRGVGFSHDGSKGVDGLDLAVRRGERVAVVGGNGAGKSTLIGLLSGRLRPGSGDVLGVTRRMEVPQNADLVLFSATAAREVAYAADERGRDPNPALLDAFGLAGLEARAPQSLSRGQRLRLAVAAMVAAEPGVLLLDEAGSGQDAESLARLFQAVWAGSETAVFASHDPELVAAWASRVVWMDGGRIREDAPVASSGWLTARASVAPAEVSPRSAGEGRAGLDARLRLALVALLGLLVVLVDGTAVLGLLAVALVGAAVVHPKARPFRRGLVLGTVLVAWSTAFSQSVFWSDWPRTPLLSLGPVTFWREGAMHGLAQSTRFIAVTAAGLLLALSTPTDELVTALRTRVAGRGLPWALVVMVAAMVRFVPLVAMEWGTVRRARRARGRPMWRRTPWAWLGLEVALLRPVVARCVRRARMLAESLESRGFDPASPRGVARPLTWRRLDTLVAAVAGITALAMVTARTLYGLYAADIWYDADLRPLYAYVRALL